MLGIVRLRGSKVFWVGISTVAIAVVVALNFARVPADARAGFLEGRVWKVDPDARMIHVSSRLFGLGATPVVITNDTLVIADNKEGAFGDLHEGLLVRVAWEKRQGAWLARAVEVGGRMGEPARPSEILSILERASAPEPALPASTISDEPSAESRRAEPSRVSLSPAAKVAPAQRQTPAVNLMRGSHANRDRAPASSPDLAPAPTSAPSDRAAATGETVATPREPDPTAIIDWLLKRVP